MLLFMRSEQTNQIVALGAEHSAADIARKFGITRQRVSQILKSAGVARHRKIGMYRRREYKCWWAMLDRCFNPQNKSFHHYGGRGITVCARWMSFENFFADMGLKPTKPRISIERVNNDG